MASPPRSPAARSGVRALPVILALAGCGPPAPPSIALVSLDTTRADRLGVYGYGAGTTPNLDRFAERATIYDRAYATSSWTLPAHASIFTGLLPMEHGAQSAPGAPERELVDGVRPLDESFATLAELLAESGYRTGAVVGGPALRRELGVAQGFEFYDDELGTPGARAHGKRAEEVADAAIALVERFGAEPYFLFANFFDPHAPYEPPAPFSRGLAKPFPINRLGAMIEQLDAGAAPRPVSDYGADEREWIARMLAGYDAEIRYVDAHLGRLLAAIEESPRADETLIVVTSDHGESFGEHYFVSHGAHLYDHNVRVPLLVRTPGADGARRVETPVANHQLFATLLRAAGVPVPEGADSRDLDAGGEIVMQVKRNHANIQLFGSFFDRDLLAIQVWPHKLVVATTGEPELFDLERDPEELNDRFAAEPALARRLAEKLRQVSERHPARFREESRAQLSPTTEEALRALGYID